MTDDNSLEEFANKMTEKAKVVKSNSHRASVRNKRKKMKKAKRSLKRSKQS